MKTIVTIFILLLSVQTQARPSQKETGFHFLNYRDFIALSREDQASYLDEMRALALQSEKSQNQKNASELTLPSFWASLLVEQARAASGDMCIYAGYISRRDSSNNCAPPPGSTGSCGAGKTLCNPLLYGYGPSSSGICTSERVSPTNDCEKQYQTIPNYKAYQVANQLVSKDMQAKFDAQAEQLSSYCGSSLSSGQQSLCRKLKDKTAYMKAKLEASEQRKKNREKEKAQAQAAADKPQEEKPVPAPVTTTPAPSSPNSSSTATPPTASASSGPSQEVSGAKPSSSPSTPAPAPAPAAEPEPPAAKATAVAKKEEKKDEPEKKQEKLSEDGCIHNQADFDAREGKLPPAFRNMDKKPVYFTAHTGQVTSALQLKMVNGKFKLISAVWPPSFYAAPWLAEDGVTSICPGKTSGSFEVIKDNGSAATVSSTGNGIKVTTKDGSLDYSPASAGSYNATFKEVSEQGAKTWINGRVRGAR